MLVAAMLLALMPAFALATPGQSVAQFTAWAKANPALRHLAKKKSEMSGLPYYTAAFQAGKIAGTFLANVDEGGKISDESVAVSNAPESYDILKHREVAAVMVATVYGSSVSGDFSVALKLGSWRLKAQTQQTELYRGKLFGYEVAYQFVQLLPLAQVAGEAKRLQSCVNTECGD